MTTEPCSDCHEPIQANLTQCPHCGRPSRFPNVIAALAPEENAALDARLQDAQRDLTARGVENKALEFAKAVESAKAVINRYFGELQRLAWSDTQVYATYYQKVQAGLQLPESDRWNRLRGIADTILFGDENKQHIRFAALSLDGTGLDNYGDCSLVLKRSMIEHRATLFEENSVIFMKRHGINGIDDFEAPRGYRSTWARRIDLCLAKLASRILPNIEVDEFNRILLAPGTKAEDDDFVEVHIWGSLTIRSFQRVQVKKWVAAPSRAEKLAIKARLGKFGVILDCP